MQADSCHKMNLRNVWRIIFLFQYLKTISRQPCYYQEGPQLPVPWYAKTRASTRHFSTRAVPAVFRAVPVPRWHQTTPTFRVSRRTVPPSTVRTPTPTNLQVPTATRTRLKRRTSVATPLPRGSWEVTPLDVTTLTWPFRAVRERSGCSRAEGRSAGGCQRDNPAWPSCGFGVNFVLRVTVARVRISAGFSPKL